MTRETYDETVARFEAWRASAPPLVCAVPGSEFARFVRWCAKDLAQSIVRAELPPPNGDDQREKES